MKITYIVTVTPVIPTEYLNLLVFSFNQQTCSDFNVIFYSQVRHPQVRILANLEVVPNFDYVFFRSPSDRFFGDYPLWDLYAAHQELLNSGLLGSYFMSLHMEEFLEPDYTSCALNILSHNALDILLGNLYSTPYSYSEIEGVADYGNPDSIHSVINSVFPHSRKWSLPTRPWFLTRSPLRNLKATYALGFRKHLKRSDRGYILLNTMYLEDIYFMRTEFAKSTGWFDSPLRLYMEDIHISRYIASELRSFTDFPIYMNAARAFHLRHPKFYYQFADEDFAKSLLELDDTNPSITALQEAISLYNSGDIGIHEALKLSRRQGAMMLNVAFHKQILRDHLQC